MFSYKKAWNHTTFLIMWGHITISKYQINCRLNDRANHSTKKSEAEW